MRGFALILGTVLICLLGMSIIDISMSKRQMKLVNRLAEITDTISTSNKIFLMKEELMSGGFAMKEIHTMYDKKIYYSPGTFAIVSCENKLALIVGIDSNNILYLLKEGDYGIIPYKKEALLLISSKLKK